METYGIVKIKNSKSIDYLKLIKFNKIFRNLCFFSPGLKIFPIFRKSNKNTKNHIENYKHIKYESSSSFFLNHFLRRLEFGKRFKYIDLILFFKKIYQKKKIYFEETADQLKISLDKNLMKVSISKNKYLGGSWISTKSSYDLNLIFWKNYFSACYNFMTRYKNKDDFKVYENLKQNRKIKGFENVNFELFKITNVASNEKKVFSADLMKKNDRTVIAVKNCLAKSSIFWRNRKKNFVFLFKKKIKKKFQKISFIKLR
jgi:hypothetical protein